MTSFTVLSLAPCHDLRNALRPTPNASDTEYIVEALSRHKVPDITDLMTGPIRILATYRGWNLYCEGGVTVYRTEPKSTGGHGFAGEPLIGSTEDVTIYTVDECSKAVIQYHATAEPPSYLKEYAKIEYSLRLKDGQWHHDFFSKWAWLIMRETGINTHPDQDGHDLTREELASLAHVTAMRRRRQRAQCLLGAPNLIGSHSV